VACGEGDRSPGWPTSNVSSDRVEGRLVRARHGLSLERCAPGDGLLWRNRPHQVASLGARGNLESVASHDVDHVESQKTTAPGDSDHRLGAGACVRWW